MNARKKLRVDTGIVGWSSNNSSLPNSGIATPLSGGTTPLLSNRNNNNNNNNSLFGAGTTGGGLISTTSATSTTTTTTTTTTTAQDTHPFARGAVIEVWHIAAAAPTVTGSTVVDNIDDSDDEDEWWSGSDVSDNVVDDDETNAVSSVTHEIKNVKENGNSISSQIKKSKKKDKLKSNALRTIRLCDIIDRAPILTSINNIDSRKQGLSQQQQQQQQWRYYVHYRDFNRRMDEWITMDRIVSPPSIGNAKARQIKKQEERERQIKARLSKQQQFHTHQEKQSLLESASLQLFTQQQQQQQQLLNDVGGVNTPTGRNSGGGGGDLGNGISNSRRRRTTAVLSTNDGNAGASAAAATSDILDTATGASIDSAVVGGGGGGGPGRRRRLPRRKTQSFMDDGIEPLDDHHLDLTHAISAPDLLNILGDGNNTTLPTNRNTSGVATNAATWNASSAGGGYNRNSSSSNHKKDGHNNNNQLLVSTQTIGEHVVGTVQAVELDEHEGLDEASLREHEEVTKVKNVGYIELGRHQMETWYFSPLPKELLLSASIPTSSTTSSSYGTAMTPNPNSASGNTGSSYDKYNTGTVYLDVLYVCEFTLRMFSRKCELQRYQTTIPVQDRHPPGNEIYRHNGLAMFELDGYEEKIYCQNLCYIAKLFLDHKTLYFDVDPFLFYVMCEVDNRGYHIVGYFSKEKYSDVGYNLACILSFPAHQRKGYGRFLISFSYELSKKEEKVGSPEKPMSDLGQQAYKPYWASTIIDFLLYKSSTERTLSIMDIAKRTSIMTEDIIYTLNLLGLLKILNGVYFVAAEQTILQALAIKYPIKEPRVDASKIHWTPYVVSDIKRDKFSIHSKKPNIEMDE